MCFFCCCAKGTRLLVYSSMTMRPAASAVETASQVVATTGGTLSAFTGTGGNILVNRRATSIMALSSCDFSHTEPLDYALAPLRISLVDSKGAYYRGGILRASSTDGVSSSWTTAVTESGTSCLS